MSNDFPDVHHKLCKKAAHLTAAFYYLNLKNDENNLILQTTIQAYEQELDNIIKIANGILDKHIKDNPQYKEVKEIHAAYQKFKQGIEQEREAAIKEFKDYKKAVEEKEKQREEEVGNLIKGYEQEIEMMREKLKYLEGLFEKLNEASGKNEEKEKEEKELKENLEAKDKEIESLKQKNEELESLCEELKGKNKSLKDLEDAKTGENETMIKDLKTQLSKMEKEMENNKKASAKALKDKEEEFEVKLKKTIKDHLDVVNEFNGKMKKMKEDFDKDGKAKDERIASLEDKLRQSDELLAKLKLEALNKEKEEELLKEIQKLYGTLEENKKLFNEKLDMQNKRAEETRLRTLQEAKVEKEKCLEILRIELFNERKIVEAEKDGKIKDLEAQLKVFLDGPSADDLAAEYQNKINAMSQRHNNQVRELIEKHDEKMDHTTKHYERELSEISNALEREKENVMRMKDEDKKSEIGNLKKEYEAKLQKVSKSFDQQLQEKIHEYELKLNDKDIEASNLETEINNLKTKLKREKKKSEEKDELCKCKDLQNSKPARSGSLKSSQIINRTKSLFDMMGINFKELIQKFKEEDYDDKGREEIITDHLQFADKVDKFVFGLQRQHEDKLQMMMDQYNALIATKTQDLDIIRALQEENMEREEELRRITNGSKDYLPDVITKRETQSYTKGFSSQASLGSASLTIQTEKMMKKNHKLSVGPQTTTSNTSNSILPPITVTQKTLLQRAAQLNSGLMQPKKLFK